MEQVPPPRLLAQDAKRQDKIAAGEKFRASEDDHGKRAAEADAHGHAHGAGLSLDEIVTQDMIGAEENVHALRAVQLAKLAFENQAIKTLQHASGKYRKTL